MISSTKAVSIGHRLTYLVRFASTNINSENFMFKPKFTEEEQQRILNILNESNAKQLSRYEVIRPTIKKFESCRDKEGPFRTLSDILKVEGLEVNVLEALCESILTEQEDPPAKISKTKKSILYPTLTLEDAKHLNSAIGFHLKPTGISWAKLGRTNNDLTDWNFYDFSDLPKKVLPVDTFKLAIKILNTIPPADVYIFEAFHQPQGQKPTKTISPYTHQLELTSMLMALINTSVKHNPSITTNKKNSLEYTNKIYYLKSNLPARMFKTLVGNERVSATEAVTSVLEHLGGEMPCTPISIDRAMKNQYYSCTPAQCDFMGQALLLVIAFMDLCVYMNPHSYSAINPRKKSSKIKNVGF